MAYLFRRKVTPLELVGGLLRYPRADFSLHLNKLGSGIDKQRVREEFTYLMSFIVDYATQRYFGSVSPETKGILEVYYFHLRDLSKKGVFFPDFYETYYFKRLPTYSNAVVSPHKNGIPYTFGKAFAEFCGVYLDTEMIMIGSDFSVNSFELITNFLKDYKVVL